jgi:protein-S-isoprenylcysteine O-methyltransferase Ste14
MPVIALVILVVWIAFWIYWFAASFRVKEGRTGWGRFAGIRIAAGLIILLLARGRIFKGHTVTHAPWQEGLGLAIFLAGLAVAVWARRYLGGNWGAPMSQKVDPELVTTGPYREVRHPIYSGLILALVGTAVAVSWYWLIAVALLGGFFIYSATREERYMTTRFPDAYPGYKQSTKMLIPLVF